MSNTESLVQSYSLIRKFNPLVLVLGFGLMLLFFTVFSSSMKFDLKLIASCLTLILVSLIVAVEMVRIEKKTNRIINLESASHD